MGYVGAILDTFLAAEYVMENITMNNWTSGNVSIEGISNGPMVAIDMVKRNGNNDAQTLCASNELLKLAGVKVKSVAASEDAKVRCHSYHIHIISYSLAAATIVCPKVLAQGPLQYFHALPHQTPCFGGWICWGYNTGYFG